MKTHAHVVVLKTGENRRKQGFRARKSFQKKSEKARKKDFFRRAARLFFEIFALCRALIDRGTADRVHQKRRSIENYIA